MSEEVLYNKGGVELTNSRLSVNDSTRFSGRKRKTFKASTIVSYELKKGPPLPFAAGWLIGGPLFLAYVCWRILFQRLSGKDIMLICFVLATFFIVGVIIFFTKQRVISIRTQAGETKDIERGHDRDLQDLQDGLDDLFDRQGT
jgi:hypothetical protein